jgi:hypothetical protein
LAGRVSPDDLAFAELERLAGFTGGGAASEALAGVELRSEPVSVGGPLSVGGPASLGGVAAGGGVA